MKSIGRFMFFLKAYLLIRSVEQYYPPDVVAFENLMDFFDVIGVPIKSQVSFMAAE